MINKFEINVKALVEAVYCKKIDCNNFELNSVSTIENPQNNTLIFISKLTSGVQEKIDELKNCLILINGIPFDFKANYNNFIIQVENPRKEYAKILEYIMKNQKVVHNYKITESGYSIGENVIIGTNTIIEPFVTIEHDVNIGSNCIIKSGARINKYCNIGDDCIIRENSVIGGEGFGIERGENKVSYKIPHLGGVIIGNNVEVGALTSVASGTIEPTIIGDCVKIDDCVFIAHNCKIESGTFIIAKAEISGSVHIGQNSWIGPSSSIIQKVRIGDNVTIGIGAVVIKNVSDNDIMAGNPADNIEIFKNIRMLQKELIKKK